MKLLLAIVLCLACRVVSAQQFVEKDDGIPTKHIQRDILTPHPVPQSAIGQECANGACAARSSQVGDWRPRNVIPNTVNRLGARASSFGERLRRILPRNR